MYQNSLSQCYSTSTSGNKKWNVKTQLGSKVNIVFKYSLELTLEHASTVWNVKSKITCLYVSRQDNGLTVFHLFAVNHSFYVYW